MSDCTWLWAPQAWIAGRWQQRVLLQIGADGHWAAMQPDVPAPPQARVLAGPLLPGLVNAHSHAFQRAFAGLAERREGEQDDFWSWRDRMYCVALRIAPEALEAVATQLYAELLQGGYTQVCEFHYLHHAPDGRPYADPLAMSHALLRAAQATGIGLTLLPVLYQRAGFTQPQLREDQRRFATDVQLLLTLRDGIRALRQPRVNAGVAIHSLRAASPEAITRLADALAGDDAPIHIHIAEQTGEVDDCLAATGRRPIEWLAAHVALDARWQLVHATHATPQEIDTVARGGAGVVICPSTEANLGDGLTDLPRWLRAGTVLSLGSDSHVGRAWPAELRLLDYGQRLHLRQRNVSAAPQQGQPSTAAHLFERLRAGGGAAAGFARWGLETGARADWLVLDMRTAGLLGVPPGLALDALVFATDAPAFSEVGVAGRVVVRQGAAQDSAGIAQRFAETLSRLWA
ncbi:formimidoylglutamate deiminase [Aquabacterium sp.]|uniref:formimidoylglutamate deiminase n=1 Tax=Aquabacterium sp. TaxID=1872578 RepID=UPI002B9E9847|nr:formimidoylglutamate deiminase [Aquabacterium sp.]HSW08077.1 formimidoylglutamate deiminase [Aquabacterium sp.]